MRVVCIVVLVAALANVILGAPTGAPICPVSSDEMCGEMCSSTVNSGGKNYTLNLGNMTNNEYEPGMVYTFTLSSITDTFKGFNFVAVSGTNGIEVGTVATSQTGTKINDNCGNDKGVTHSDATTITFAANTGASWTWTAPAAGTGTVELATTIITARNGAADQCEWYFISTILNEVGDVILSSSGVGGINGSSGLSGGSNDTETGGAAFANASMLLSLLLLPIAALVARL